MQYALTIGQLEELKRYAKEHGRCWKSELLVDWMNARCSAELQQIRNAMGPSWLQRFRFSNATMKKEGLN